MTTHQQHVQNTMQAVNRLMNDIQSRPVEDLICSFGTIFGSRYYTVEPIGGNWLEMETWCTETFEQYTVFGKTIILR